MASEEDSSYCHLQDSDGEAGERTTKQFKKILVIDDEDDQLDVMTHILRDTYTVTGVNSGKEAINRLNNDEYDMIICDFKMPGIDCRGI